MRAIITAYIIMSACVKAFPRGISHQLLSRVRLALEYQQHQLSTGTSNVVDVSSTSSIVDRMRQEAEDEMKKVVELYASSSSSSSSVATAALSSLSPSNKPLLWTTPAQARAFLDENKVDTYLFDCDGVLYRSPDQAPGARACIQSLLERGKNVFFVTNNAGSNRSQLREKLANILELDGLLTEDMMLSSSYSCAQYLKREILGKDKKKGTLYVIGSEGLCDELRDTGFEVRSGGSTDTPSMTREELAEYDFSADHPVDAVVVGHDIEFNFRKLCIANVLLQMNPEASLIATNKDSFDLVGVDARHIPGNGALVSALEYSSKRRAFNVGKPSTFLADLIQREHGLDPKRSVMVGDRLDTDVRFGNDNGMYSALVMTGVTTAKQLESLGGGTIEEPLPSVILPFVGFMA